MQASIQWLGKMAFTASDSNGNQLRLDAPEAVGGDNNGFRPKQLLLDSLGGCTAMDVISILTKMQQIPTTFTVAVTATEAEDHPKELSNFHISYQVSDNVDPQKLQKAIDLSLKRYCAVTAMFNKFTTVSHEIVWISGNDSIPKA